MADNGKDAIPTLVDTILSDIVKFPDEAAIIGRLVVGYGVIELSLWRSLAAHMGVDEEATRLMFQRMGEKARIDVVEAALRSPFVTLGMGRELTSAIKSVHKCREIRNRYAHTYWDGDGDFLRFAALEKAAKGSGEISVELQPLPLDLLIEQEERFVRCRAELNALADAFNAAKVSMA